MKIQTVEYSNEVTVNTGNFQNVRPGFRLVAELEEGDDATETARALKEKVDYWLDKSVAKIQSELNS